MRKCPDCAEENLNETLFCKHCGCCLLAPDPEEGQRSIATYTEHYATPEGIDFYDGHIVEKSGVARLRRTHETAPSVNIGWVLLLNLLAFALISEILKYIFSLATKL